MGLYRPRQNRKCLNQRLHCKRFLSLLCSSCQCRVVWIGPCMTYERAQRPFPIGTRTFYLRSEVEPISLFNSTWHDSIIELPLRFMHNACSRKHLGFIYPRHDSTIIFVGTHLLKSWIWFTDLSKAFSWLINESWLEGPAKQPPCRKYEERIKGRSAAAPNMKYTSLEKRRHGIRDRDRDRDSRCQQQRIKKRSGEKKLKVDGPTFYPPAKKESECHKMCQSCVGDVYVGFVSNFYWLFLSPRQTAPNHEMFL